MSHNLELLRQGDHASLYHYLGAHKRGDGTGTCFRVWAPNADRVSVLGDFNGWTPDEHPLASLGDSGVWEGEFSGVGTGELYKYCIRNRWSGDVSEKADPLAFSAERAPCTASVITDLDYSWSDQAWMEGRKPRHQRDAPISIYEVHLGSFAPRGEQGEFRNYRELAVQLADHVESLGYTHVQLLPLQEHPFDGSWGYQVTGYFAPTSRFGSPQDCMALVDILHQRGIGVILDWVPAHFPLDPHGLATFDGTALYEHADPRMGFHPDWKTAIFNYGRDEVRSFLLSSAAFWLDRYHIDGLRVDAVASMLYRDYSRAEGEWIPNPDGSRENHEAVSFLRTLNERLYGAFPDCMIIAEESTAWPGVSRPTFEGGLGFGYKWDMGWMHDTLRYFERDPVHRAYHQSELTFRALYANHENFILPLSHDEVVHGKRSLLGKMPGDPWQQFANLRLLYASQFATQGKKLHFMGAEYAPGQEWDHQSYLLEPGSDDALRVGLRRALSQLNRLYRHQPALHQGDCVEAGFQWVDFEDADKSVVSFLRRGHDPHDEVLVVLNHTPTPRMDYRVGVTSGGWWDELYNSDAREYGGSGVGNGGGVHAEPVPAHGVEFSVSLSLPPLGALFLKRPR